MQHFKQSLTNITNINTQAVLCATCLPGMLTLRRDAIMASIKSARPKLSLIDEHCFEQDILPGCVGSWGAQLYSEPTTKSGFFTRLKRKFPPLICWHCLSHRLDESYAACSEGAQRFVWEFAVKGDNIIIKRQIDVLWPDHTINRLLKLLNMEASMGRQCKTTQGRNQ